MLMTDEMRLMSLILVTDISRAALQLLLVSFPDSDL